MSAVYHAEIPVDLAMPSRQRLGPCQFFYGDSRSHIFTALVADRSDPEAGIRAGTVTGAVLRQDGVTVALDGVKGEETVQATFPDGVTASATPCSVTLTQECFAVLGPLTVTIKLTDGSGITSVLSVTGNVIRAETDEIVDPGQVIPDLAMIRQAAIDADAAAENANAAADNANAAAEHAVRFDVAQEMTDDQMRQARYNTDTVPRAAVAGLYAVEGRPVETAAEIYASTYQDTEIYAAGQLIRLNGTAGAAAILSLLGRRVIANGRSTVPADVQLAEGPFSVQRGHTYRLRLRVLGGSVTGASAPYIGLFDTEGAPLFTVTGGVITGGFACTAGSGCVFTMDRDEIGQFCLFFYKDGVYDSLVLSADLQDLTAAADGEVRGDFRQDMPVNRAQQARENIGAAALGVEDAAGYRHDLVLYGYDNTNDSGSDPVLSPFIPDHAVTAAYVTGLKLKVAAAGILTLGCYPLEGTAEGAAYDTALHTRLMTATVAGTGEQTILLERPLWIPEGCTLAIGDTSDTLRFMAGSAGTDTGFLYPNGGVFYHSARSLGVNVYTTGAMTLPLVGLSVTEKPLTLVDGYHESNNSNSSVSYEPFLLPKVTGAIVTGIKLNVYAAGALEIGIYRLPAAAGDTLDETKYRTLLYLQATETGVQTLAFQPVAVPHGYCLAVGGFRRSPCRFKYGNNGTDKGFLYGSSGALVSSNSSLGLTVYGAACEYNGEVRSALTGKKVSIYGDSISTFAGWIPEGNATYYTGHNAGVGSVESTWWMKTIRALGLELLVNNSWSGRAVSSVSDGTTAHATDAGYKEANVLQLASGGVTPDIVIVKMGINDFDREAPLGDYDGSTALPTDPSTFTNAYAIMLDRIMTNFPLARVYCCTLMACEWNGGTGFPETNGNGETVSQWNDAIRRLAGAFGATVLEHGSCGLTYYNLSTYMGDWSSSAHTGLHPNAAGHSLIANATIQAMDGAVRKRY